MEGNAIETNVPTNRWNDSVGSQAWLLGDLDSDLRPQFLLGTILPQVAIEINEVSTPRRTLIGINAPKLAQVAAETRAKC